MALIAPHLHQQVYVSKWVTFAASAMLQASAGLTYSFSVYAPTIKDALDLSQTQVALVGSAANLGGYFAIVSGSIYDQLKDNHKLGPRLVVWLGCLCCLCGYLGMYLMVSGQASKSFVQLLIFAAAAGNMGTWFDTSALVTSVRNFPNDRGFVVGVLKSFLGLSSSIYTSIYACTFEPDATRFLLMLAIVPTCLGLLLSMGLNYVPYVEASEVPHPSSRLSTQGRFLMSFLMVGALAVYQMASALIQGSYPLGQAGKTVIVGGMALLLALAALLPLTGNSWRAVYAHPYIHTRESCADDEDNEDGAGGCRGRQQQQHEGPGGSRLGCSGSPGARRGGSHAALPGFTSVPHQRFGAGQLRTLKDPAAWPASPTRPAHGSASSSSSSNLAAAPQDCHSSGGSSRRHTGVHLRSPSADDAQEASPLLLPHAASSHDNKAAAMAAVTGGGGGGTVLHQPQREQPALQLGSLSTKQMLCTLNFWLLFLQFTVASGVSLAYLNNLGQLVVSLGGEQDGQVVFVSLFSVANAAGRLLMGYIPEQYLHSRGTPRTLFLTMTAAMLAGAALANAYASLGHLYVISLLLGLAFGAHWSLLPAITSDLFGLKHFAANYTTLQFAPAAGSYLLATRLTGWLYDRAAAAHGDPHQCIGPDCFREAFLLLSGLAGLSSIACSIATSRSRHAYLAVAQHLKQVDTAEDGASVQADH